MELKKAVEILEDQKLFTPLGQACHRVLDELKRLQYYNRTNSIPNNSFDKETEFSKRLRKTLKDKNMKQTELSEKTGISKGAISQYIAGAYDPKYRNVHKIAGVLKVNPHWLMGCSVSTEVE